MTQLDSKTLMTEELRRSMENMLKSEMMNQSPGVGSEGNLTKEKKNHSQSDFDSCCYTPCLSVSSPWEQSPSKSSRARGGGSDSRRRLPRTEPGFISEPLPPICLRSVLWRQSGSMSLSDVVPRRDTDSH